MDGEMKIIQYLFIVINMLIAPAFAVASEEVPASYVAIECMCSPDKPIATVVLTTDPEFAASWDPSSENPLIILLVRAFVVDSDAYAKVYNFLATEAEKRKGQTLPLDNGVPYFEISGRNISGKVDTSGDRFHRNAFGWTLSEDIKTFAIPLKGKESLEMMKVVVKYLAGQGVGTSLQPELDKWR
jgi:hypothetical protein